jgi:hypothetical protein
MDKNDVVKEIKLMLEDFFVKSIDPKPEDEMEKSEELSDEEISKSYESDNEDEDKWDNMEKACWSGYEQQGMKDKGGRKVPNCVPIKKSADEAPINEAEKEVKKSIWGGAFLK